MQKMQTYQFLQTGAIAQWQIRCVAFCVWLFLDAKQQKLDIVVDNLRAVTQKRACLMSDFSAHPRFTETLRKNFYLPSFFVSNRQMISSAVRDTSSVGIVP
jgi:hypothetical protein